jgi:CheY-like chemotaxis protein
MRLRGDPSGIKERAVIERQVAHVSRLVDDLLDVSRITRGKIDLKRERCELADVVARAVEVASPVLEQRGHRLLVDVVRTGLPVEVDPLRFSQVLSNLLTNAAKFTPRGGEIGVNARRSGAQVALAVTDTGIGIPAEVLPRLWEPFYQGERGERAQGGLGLGLALVKSLTELHGGRVEARSAGKGRGSEFVVTIDLAAGAGRESDEGGDERSGAAAWTGRRILVVDDNTDAADGLGDLIRAMGHEVSVAYDGVQAIAEAARFRFDVAVLDIGLPVVDGYELARRLRAQAGERPIRLFALTGYGQESDRQKSRAAGFERHFTKPVSIDVLMAAVGASA